MQPEPTPHNQFWDSVLPVVVKNIYPGFELVLVQISLVKWMTLCLSYLVWPIFAPSQTYKGRYNSTAKSSSWNVEMAFQALKHMLKNLCFPLPEKVTTQGELSSDHFFLQIDQTETLDLVIIHLNIITHALP